MAWKFRPDAAPDAIDTAVAGYLRLPQALPYFSSLEVGRDTSHMPAYSVCLYSTFHDAQAQEAFVHDSRRIAFKEAFVKPHLASNAVLVFDFFARAVTRVWMSHAMKNLTVTQQSTSSGAHLHRSLFMVHDGPHPNQGNIRRPGRASVGAGGGQSDSDRVTVEQHGGLQAVTAWQWARPGPCDGP